MKRGKNRIRELENKLAQQQEEIKKLSKKVKSSSFWLTYLLLGKDK